MLRMGARTDYSREAAAEQSAARAARKAAEKPHLACLTRRRARYFWLDVSTQAVAPGLPTPPTAAQPSWISC